MAWTCLDWIGRGWIGLNCLDLVCFGGGMGHQYDKLSSGFQVAGRKGMGGEAGVSGGN